MNHLKLRRLLRLSVVGSVAWFSTASSFGADIHFDWTQSSSPDPSTGSGTIYADVRGVHYEAPMPTPIFSQTEGLLDGEVFPGQYVGFTNHSADSDDHGDDFGYFLSWGGRR